MRDKVLQLEALSPEELKNKLADMPRGNRPKDKFISIGALGSQVIARNFELPIVSAREIKNALRFEAVETFSLGAEDIEIDYQVFSAEDGKSKGVFLAMPKPALKDYYAQVSKAGYIPLALTAQILVALNAALTRIPSPAEAFYILDFIGEKSAFLALFNQGQCELLRDISYDNIAEAKQEISNSLRYALGKSSAKHPQELYFSGEVAGRDELIVSLENEFNVKSTAIDLKAAPAKGNQARGYFNLNLFKDYTATLAFRNKLSRFLNICLGLASLIFILTFIGSLRVSARVKAFKKEFDPSGKAGGYDSKIKELKEKIELLENEK